MATNSAQVMDSLAERKYLREVLWSAPQGSPVVLVGSYARGTSIRPWSDIDVLVMGEHHGPIPPPQIQLISITQERLRRRVQAGDAFAQWALRFGVALAGRQVWDKLRKELLSDAPWPTQTPQLEQASKKLATAQDLFQMGDLPAAEEEIRFALSHLARAELLAKGVFPLSRQELPAQLQEAEQPKFAQMMEKANSVNSMTNADVGDAIAFVDEILRGTNTSAEADRHCR